VLCLGRLKFLSGPFIVHTPAVLSLLVRSLTLPFALVSVAVARSSSRDCLELDTALAPAIQVDGETIRARAIVLNPTRRPVAIERIEMSVSDSLGTFILRSETPPPTVPAGYSLAVELVASNFRPLRLSRRCLFRARFFSRKKCLCAFTQIFTNVWPASCFADDGERIPLDSIPFLQGRSSDAPASIDRRRHDAGVHRA